MRFFRVSWLVRCLFRRRVWQIRSVDNSVYITFDDGPIPDVTPWVLDQLEQNQIKATFFCVGENVRKHPDIYQRIVSEGHTVGNHSMNHEKGTDTNRYAYLDSVQDASRYIHSSFFRPPYGRMTWSQSRFLRQKYKIIMWSWLSHDFDTTVSVNQILKKAEEEIKSGDIVVFHDNVKSYDRLKVILPKFIDLVKRKKLEPLPITI
jgi:peptidoglycan/xylan/chitin deacetylase (PgdA/CDA1 family)